MSEEQKEKPHGWKLFSWAEMTPNACGPSTGAVLELHEDHLQTKSQ